MGMIDYLGRKPSRAKLLRGETPNWIARRHQGGRYIAAVLLSCPPWVDLAPLRALAAESKRRTKETGVQHALDHIVPLRHPLVCGLTVPWNLQIITKQQNDSKGNRWSPDQMELFPGDDDLAPP
jgi:hypothetical protein